LVIRYDYLWQSERRKGREEGSKKRPCAVVLATASGRVIVCGITHTDPGSDDLRVELDAHMRRTLGLDDDAQWIDCSEINEVSWDDPGIEPVPSGAWAYGDLGATTAQQMLEKVRAQLSREQLAWIDRVAIEKARERRESEGK
jgi:hypothetical protein